MEVLKAKVRFALSTENDGEPQEKRTKTDDNVSLQTMYEEILQENNTKEQSQWQGVQQVIDLLFK